MSIWGDRNLAKEATDAVVEAGTPFTQELAKRMVDKKSDTIGRGLIAHVLMRAIELDPTIGKDSQVRVTLSEATCDIDFFVKENPRRALENLEHACEKSATTSTPKERGESKPKGIVPGKHYGSGGYKCPYCGVSDYEPYPNPSSENRPCKRAKQHSAPPT